MPNFREMPKLKATKVPLAIRGSEKGTKTFLKNEYAGNL